MDAQEYDAIVDKIMQFRGKIIPIAELNDRVAVHSTYELLLAIDNLLWYIDNHAKADGLGWIR